MEGEPKDKINVPSHFKKYTMVHRKILLQQLQRETTGERTSYNALEQSNFVNLAPPNEEPKLVKVAQDLSPEEETKLIQTLKDYMDVFAWSYQDLKGVDPNICQHTIPIKLDAKLVWLKPYTHNKNFAKKIKAKIDRLIEANFIYKIEHTEWVSPIVVVLKRNGKIMVCINFKKVNAATIRDNYLLPITKHVLEKVAEKEGYSFLDSFSSYN